MSEIELTDTFLIVHLRGWDRLLSWRRRVEVPLAQVQRASLGIAPEAQLVRGTYTRWPASDVQGGLKVGTFRRLREHDRVFYNIRVRSGERAITVTLTGGRYSALVIEVPDPAGMVERINAAVAAQRHAAR